MTIVGFVVVAAVATLARALFTADQPKGQIPWRTFTLNVIGSFLLGLILASAWWDNPVVVGVAGLGSLTTFSTVAAEAAALIEDERGRTAMTYVVLTVVVGIAAAMIGISIGDLL